MAGASIRVTGLASALRKLNDVKRSTQLVNAIATLVVAGVKMNFVRGVDPETRTKWAPIKHRKGEPLRNKGRLMRSIHAEKQGVGFNYRVTVGTNLIYAATHQFGDAERKPRNAKVLAFKVYGVPVFARSVSIPRRRFLPETAAGLAFTTDNKIDSVIANFLEKHLK